MKLIQHEPRAGSFPYFAGKRRLKFAALLFFVFTFLMFHSAPVYAYDSRIVSGTAQDSPGESSTGISVSADNNYATAIQQGPQQPVRVQGRIVNEATGEPVAGATIRMKSNPSIGASSNVSGEFVLTIPSVDETLQISSVGMVSTEYKLPRTYQGDRVVIRLREEKQKMDEVVVLGTFQKPVESFTGSITTITAKELNQYGSRDILTTVRNIDPSFNIIESNVWGSDPNRLPEINLRGTSSIPNIDDLTDEARSQLNTPLIIIDGFEAKLKTLYNMNVDEIAFFSILKDAAATSLYGSRGSNGVIIVETKAPVPGQLQLFLRYTGGVEMPDLTSYSLLNARDKLELEFRVGKYDNARAEFDVPLKQYYYYLLDQVNQGVDTYWLAKPLRTGLRNNLSVRAEGGDEMFRYAVSLAMNNKQGVMKGDRNNTLNASVKLAYNYKDLRFTNNFSLENNGSQKSPYGKFSDYVGMNPYLNPYNEEGKPVERMGADYTNPAGVIQRWGTSSGVANPLYDATLSSFDKTNNLTLTNNFALTWNVTPDLNLRVAFGISKEITKNDVFVSPEHSKYTDYTGDLLLRKGSYSIRQTDGMSYNGNATLNYVKSLDDKHVIQGALIYDISEESTDYYLFSAEGFTNPDMNFIGSALQYPLGDKPSGNLTKTRKVGFNGNASYIYDAKYTLEGTIRYDGSSLFGSNKRFGFFWAAGAAWLISNEAFLRDNSFINRLRIFVNAGSTGSMNFPPYQAMTTYQYYTDKRYYSWMGAKLMGIGNPDLQWQKKLEYSGGVESEFLDRRIKLKVNLYRNTTNNLLSSINIPTHTGYSSYKENVGKTQNTGYEIYFTAEVLRIPEKGISWSIMPSFMHNNNKVVELSQTMKDVQGAAMKISSMVPETYYIEGYSTNTIWAVPSLGIDPSTGKEAYIDRNGNVTFIYDPLNMVAVGDTDPKAWGSINSFFRWNNFAVTASFGFRWGAQQYNTTLMDKIENTNYNGNVDSRVFTDRWQRPGDNVFFKSIFITSPTYVTSRFVQDESTFKCQNVKVEYTFRNMKSMPWIKNITVSAEMADIFYISSIKRERGTSYPFSRIISYTLSAMF